MMVVAPVRKDEAGLGVDGNGDKEPLIRTE